MMMDFAPKASWPVLVIGTAVLLLSLYFAVRFFSWKRQCDAVKELYAYFNSIVCPRAEFAPHFQELPLNCGPLRSGKLSKTDPLCPREWLEREDEELNSPYYLRTGQQISRLAAMDPLGIWYGPESWIRDILASKGDPLYLAGIEPRDETENEETEAVL